MRRSCVDVVVAMNLRSKKKRSMSSIDVAPRVEGNSDLTHVTDDGVTAIVEVTRRFEVIVLAQYGRKR